MVRRLAQSIWLGWPAPEVSRREALGATGRIARQIEDWSSARPAGAPAPWRHPAITFALDAGASLRDVQDYASRNDPAPPAGMITPATAWTVTPPIPSPPA